MTLGQFLSYPLCYAERKKSMNAPRFTRNHTGASRRNVNLPTSPGLAVLTSKSTNQNRTFPDETPPGGQNFPFRLRHFPRLVLNSRPVLPPLARPRFQTHANPIQT